MFLVPACRTASPHETKYGMTAAERDAEIAAEPAAVRATIRAGRVEEGMSRRQVVLALGLPDDRGQGPLTLEQWLYERPDGRDLYLYFDGDRLDRWLANEKAARRS